VNDLGRSNRRTRSSRTGWDGDGPPRIPAEERERWRLARELRDGVGQLVALVSMRIEALRTAPDSEREDLLRALEELCAALGERFSALSFELSPIILFDLGLRAAVEALAEDLAARTGLRLQIRGDEDPELDADVALALFRALRELFLGGSTPGGGEARLHITDAGAAVRVEIWRTGRPGPDDVGGPPLRRRIHDLGGTLSIARGPDAILHTVIEVPHGPAHWAPPPA